MAPYFNMIFEYQPVYFNYNEKTWLIEFWKGQYGISTGSEAGVYCADRIVPPEDWNTTLFRAVNRNDYLEIFMRLRKNSCPVASLRQRHWWLTIFSIGCFSHPEELSVDISIRFPDLNMRDAFLNAILEQGLSSQRFSLCLSPYAEATPTAP